MLPVGAGLPAMRPAQTTSYSSQPPVKHTNRLQFFQPPQLLNQSFRPLPRHNPPRQAEKLLLQRLITQRIPRRPQRHLNTQARLPTVHGLQAIRPYVGVAEGCDLLILIFSNIEAAKRSQPSAAPTREVCAGGRNRFYRNARSISAPGLPAVCLAKRCSRSDPSSATPALAALRVLESIR